MNTILSKTDYDSALKAVENILSGPVEKTEISDRIPTLSDISDSNNAFRGKLSILFVDMRKSTELTEELKAKKMVKIYRSFIRLIIQAIRYSGGFSRQFAGDGIMGVFQDTNDDDIKKLSSDKAIRAGRYIITLVNYCLNPLLKKYMDGISIACGVGICTGTILITKAGMRGKEGDQTSENEVGIVWVGSATNYASRYSGLAKGSEIFIDEETYKESKEDKEKWVQCSRVRGTRAYKGYIAEDYYLELDEEIETEPIKAILETYEDNSFIQDIFDQTEDAALSLIDAIAEKSAEVALKISELAKREEQVLSQERDNAKNLERLNQLQIDLNKKQSSVDSKEKRNINDEYDLYRDFFLITFCHEKLIVQLGKDFWLEIISKMFSLGKKIGKSETNVKSDLDCYLVDIYYYLGMYEEAYDALCIQAEYGSWIHDSQIEPVVNKSQHWYRLREILKERINPGINKENDFLNALKKLKSMGYGE